MKRSLLGLFLTLGMINGALADDRDVAPPDLIEELKVYCQEVATEDGTDDKPLPEFLLECINEELESEDYQPITKLPE